MTKMFKVLAPLALLAFGLVIFASCDPLDTITPKINVSPGTANVIGGGTTSFTATIKDLPDGIVNTIVWSVVEMGTHGGTFIDENGLLTVAAAEKQSKLTVRAALHVDPSIFGQAVVNVTPPDPIITGLELNAASTTGVRGKTLLFSVNLEGLHNPPLFMDWEIVTAGKHAETTITGGLLTIAAAETLNSITVKATSQYDPDFSDEATIAIVSALAGVDSVSAGANHTVIIGTDGSLWAWGNNQFGQVGDGTTGINRISFSRIGTQTNWEVISAGDGYTMAISNGTLWAWGNNADGRTGLGLTTGTTNTPTQVGTDTNWRAVSAGRSHTLAIKTDGTLWAWGNNANGRTGLGTETGTTNAPTRVGTASNWEFISAGFTHSIGIRETDTERTAWAWGNGANGRLGTGNTNSVDVPTQSGTATNWDSVEAGNIHSAGVRNGELHAVGSTDFGVLGGNWGTGQQSANWMRVGATITNYATVSAGPTHTMATRTNGTLWATGSTNNGQLGGGWGVAQTSTSFMAVLAAVTTWSAVSAGDGHTMALREDGSLWATGANSAGQHGDGTIAQRLTFAQVIP